jgi:hypothetical protein
MEDTINTASAENTLVEKAQDISLASNISRKRGLDETDEDRPKSCAKKKPGRPANTQEHVGMFTAMAIKERASKLEEEMAEEAARRVRDLTLRATCRRSLDAGRSAEQLVHNLKLAPTADIVAKAQEGVEVLLKIAEVLKNLKGGLRKDVWQAAATLMAANQALSLRAQRAERDTPQGDGGGEEVTLRYEVSRLKRENDLLKEELRLLKERVEGLSKLPPTPERKTPSPKK